MRLNDCPAPAPIQAAHNPALRNAPRGSEIVIAGSYAPALEVASGLLRLDRVEAGSPTILVGVALPGDVVGPHALVGEPHCYTARALVDSTVRELPVRRGAPPSIDPLASLLRQHERAADVATLRTGDVASRIRNLLRLLAQACSQRDDAARCRLPSLHDMADLIDSAPETVSRAVCALRREGVLQAGAGRVVCFSQSGLAEIQGRAGRRPGARAARAQGEPAAAH